MFAQEPTTGVGRAAGGGRAHQTETGMPPLAEHAPIINPLIDRAMKHCLIALPPASHDAQPAPHDRRAPRWCHPVSHR